MSHLGVRLMLEQAGFEVVCIVPWNVSGFEAILKSLIGLKQLYFLIYPLVLLLNIILFFRKIAFYVYLFLYKNNLQKKSRINEYINEDASRFTSGFNYIAVKKNK